MLVTRVVGMKIRRRPKTSATSPRTRGGLVSERIATTTVLPSVVVHVRVDVLVPVAVNVPATALTLLAPYIPSATAYPVATSATSSAAM